MQHHPEEIRTLLQGTIADATVTEVYRARKTPLGGTARTVSIVDKDGIIRYAKRGMPRDEELLDVLKGF